MASELRSTAIFAEESFNTDIADGVPGQSGRVWIGPNDSTIYQVALIGQVTTRSDTDPSVIELQWCRALLDLDGFADPPFGEPIGPAYRMTTNPDNLTPAFFVIAIDNEPHPGGAYILRATWISGDATVSSFGEQPQAFSF